MRILLSLGIAILYPVVVYFAVVTLIPRSDTGQYPSYPNCQRQAYDFTTRTYSRNDACERQHEEYNAAVKAHNDARLNDSERNVHRAQLALGIALATIMGAMLLRDVKELMMGLALGSTVVLLVASTVALTIDGGDPAIASSLLTLFGFLLLTGMLYFMERSLPEAPATPSTTSTDSAQSVPTPQHPHDHQPPVQ